MHTTCSSRNGSSWNSYSQCQSARNRTFVLLASKCSSRKRSPRNPLSSARSLRAPGTELGSPPSSSREPDTISLDGARRDLALEMSARNQSWVISMANVRKPETCQNRAFCPPANSLCSIAMYVGTIPRCDSSRSWYPRQKER